MGGGLVVVYQVLNKQGVDAYDVSLMLNQWYATGWELVATTPIGGNGVVQYIFKKKEDDA